MYLSTQNQSWRCCWKQKEDGIGKIFLTLLGCFQETYVFLAFFPCWNKMLGCRQMKAEVIINLLQNCFNQKWTFNLLAYFVQTDKFLLNCIYSIVLILDLLNLRTVVFRRYQKKYFIFKFIFTIFQMFQVKRNVQNSIRFLFFFQNTRLFINRIFLNTFQMKI